MNVLIADDELLVLEGLKYIIDWNALGFTVCDTAANGEEALEKILALQPELVLMDIRMPKKNGIDVVKEAADKGYSGKFIILSGISDFKFAQTAMRYGVDFYLTKPIDEDELAQAVSSVRSLILKEAKTSSSLNQYRAKAKESILKELLLGTCDYRSLDLKDLHLDANIYQVVSYENYNQGAFYPAWNFSELMRVSNQDNTTFDVLVLEQQNLILLKGNFAISKFENMLDHYRSVPQKGSPFDSIFLSYGRKVLRIQDIHVSYEDVRQLSARRFFLKENQHIIGYGDLETGFDPDVPSADLAPEYAQRLCGYIQSHNRTLITETWKELSSLLSSSGKEIVEIKHFLADVYIHIKQKIMQLYPQTEIPFLANASVLSLIESKYYLYEIIAFLAEQVELLMNSVGYSSGENIMNEVLYYIHHNYQDNLRLETIAPLFGYNSSYLGKVFSKKMGMNFNSYLDQVRIDESKKLLADDKLKVYEIAKRIGYKDVDYFHKKFKKYVGTSPAEYRKALGRSS